MTSSLGDARRSASGRSKHDHSPFASHSPFMSALNEHENNLHELSLTSAERQLSMSSWRSVRDLNKSHSAPAKAASKPVPEDPLLLLLRDKPALNERYGRLVRERTPEFMEAKSESQLMQLGVDQPHAMSMLTLIMHVRHQQLLARVNQMKLEI